MGYMQAWSVISREYERKAALLACISAQIRELQA
jgi:hypothetical protein